MNSDTFAQIREALGAPTTRALLVTMGDDGKLEHQPVQYGQSVVRIETELRDHLEAKPYSTEWLIGLRDYLDQRLAALAEAEITNGFIIPQRDGYVVAHVSAFEPVEVQESEVH